MAYFGVKVDGHKTMLGFGISATSEHSTVWSGNLADIHWTLSSPFATFTWRSLSDVNWRYWMEVIPLAIVARGSSSVPTRESTLYMKSISAWNSQPVPDLPFSSGTGEIFGERNVKGKVGSFFWTVWEINHRSISFGDLPLKKRGWEWCCTISFTDTNILSRCLKLKLKKVVLAEEKLTSEVKSACRLGDLSRNIKSWSRFIMDIICCWSCETDQLLRTWIICTSESFFHISVSLKEI